MEGLIVLANEFYDREMERYEKLLVHIIDECKSR
jgi:hypothetical protein